MQKLIKPYRGSINLTSGVYFSRTSREAFGHGIKFEKPSRDYWHFIGAALLIAVIIWVKLS